MKVATWKPEISNGLGKNRLIAGHAFSCNRALRDRKRDLLQLFTHSSPHHPASVKPVSTLFEFPSKAMAKDYQRLWKDAISAKDETKCVRILADILADQEGRRFALGLGRGDAEWCIEILDRASHDLDLPPSFVF